MYKLYIFLILLVCSLTASAQYHHHQRKETKHHHTTLQGKVINANGEPISYATVQIKGTSNGCVTDENGFFKLGVPLGEHIIKVSSVGYETVEKHISVNSKEDITLSFRLRDENHTLKEVSVVSNGVERINKTAYNVIAVDAKALYNTSKTLGEVLAKVPGVKIRETGGVGSEMQISIDGFSGKHVRVFIDGVPQEGAGSGFDLSNMPVNLAERIEVYRGVVPVGYGTDALGGVINIVTNQHKKRWFADASYTYGSFNTHRSYAHIGQSFKNGLTYEITGFQNYSDNSYKVNTWVKEFNSDGSVPPIDESAVNKLKRFHDTFHNETLGAKVGIKSKSWADNLMLGLTYTHTYKDIQNGVYQHFVFGEKHRYGWSVVPSIAYTKRDLFVKNLDLQLYANYNYNITHNIDTTTYEYNWRGMRRDRRQRGEQTLQNIQQKNTNWNGTLTMNYRLGDAHTITFNHVMSLFRRTNRSIVDATAKFTDYSIPSITQKYISGLSYRYLPSQIWNLSVFGKHYHQYNSGAVSQSTDGIGNYAERSKTIGTFGYGMAGTYLPIKGLQIKVSYEHAYRLPTGNELFGDGDLEAGRANLKPENSDNINCNVNYGISLGKHTLFFEGGWIYRNTKDYIRRGIDTYGGTGYAFYENHGRVETKGYNLSARYGYAGWLDTGIAYNRMDARDMERFVGGNTGQESLHYKSRIPNQPYEYANADIQLKWKNLGRKDNVATLSYDAFWQREFPLFWENLGDPNSKHYVPSQMSHNVTLTYSMCKAKYNLSLECRNLTDALLYDNYSLQKAGRAFYVKVRVNL